MGGKNIQDFMTSVSIQAKLHKHHPEWSNVSLRFCTACAHSYTISHIKMRIILIIHIPSAISSQCKVFFFQMIS